MSDPEADGAAFVHALRAAAPYVHAHHGRTFVVAFSGDIAARDDLHRLLADLALLTSLGVRLVLVHGARPQIQRELDARGITSEYAGDLRVTTPSQMRAVKAAVGTLRMDIEAQLSASLSNTPMAGSRVRVVGGTWVTARPMGVRDGVDHELTGQVRRVEIAEIRDAVAGGRVVLLSPVGHSPTGETFNLRHADVALAVATGLGADKLIFVMESEPGTWRAAATAGDAGQLTLGQARRLLEAEMRDRELPEEDRAGVRAALAAAQNGVRRVHLIGAEGVSPLLRELYTRDGCGLMFSAADDYEAIRPATPEDVTGIMELIAPLEAEGSLVPRTREQVEADLATFTVVVRDGTVIACNALVPYPEEAAAEFACVAVHPDYRGLDLAALLLARARTGARQLGARRLFALTTRTAHWFVEHGFTRAGPADLPAGRRATWQPGRGSIVLVEDLAG